MIYSKEAGNSVEEPESVVLPGRHLMPELTTKNTRVVLREPWVSHLEFLGNHVVPRIKPGSAILFPGLLIVHFTICRCRGLTMQHSEATLGSRLALGGAQGRIQYLESNLILLHVTSMLGGYDLSHFLSQSP